MRTNIEIDDKALEDLMRATGAKTKRQAVNHAIREQLRRTLARKAILDLAGKVEWEGDLDAMRRDHWSS